MKPTDPTQDTARAQQYGLVVPTDDSGYPAPIDHSYTPESELAQQYLPDGQDEVTIQVRPPVLEEFARYEEYGQGQASVDDLREVLERHLIEPSDKPVERMTLPEVFTYVEGVMSVSVEGGAGDMMDEVGEHIEARQTGNGT